MTNTLSYAIEARDASGCWHTVFVSALTERHWWSVRARDHTDTHAIDTACFAALLDHPHAVLEALATLPGQADLWDAIPYDAASASVHHMHWHGWSKRQHGALDGHALASLQASLEHDARLRPTLRAQALAFVAQAQQAIAIITGHDGIPPLLLAPVPSVPCDPNTRPTPMMPTPTAQGTAHGALAFAARWRSGAGFAKQDARILMAHLCA